MGSINPYYNEYVFPYKISLAQFSLFRLEMSREIDPMNFAKISNELGFDGLEYLQISYTGGLLREKKKTSLNHYTEPQKPKDRRYSQIRHHVVWPSQE